MNILTACKAIQEARGPAILIATMGAMVAFDKLDAGQPRLNSVPLMGGSASLGMGLALAHPDRTVIVVDGDASLLMQLGALVTVAGKSPRNFHHFLINNGTQFSGLSNLSLPGRQIDYCALAAAAGYPITHRIQDEENLTMRIRDILSSGGPSFIELTIEPDPPIFGADSPQQDWSDHQFTRMGDEARQLAVLLANRGAA